MDKLVIFLILVTLLSMADCHHQYTRPKKSSNRLKLSTKNSQFLESYLNGALKKLQQDSQISTENNNNTVISQNEDRENVAKQLIRQSISNNEDTERSKLPKKRANQADKVSNKNDKAAKGVASKPGHRKSNQRFAAPTPPARPSFFNPRVHPKGQAFTRPPTLRTTISSKSTPRIKLPTWQVLKRLIKHEFKKHYRNIHRKNPPPKAMVIHEYDGVKGQDGIIGNLDPVPKAALFISDKSPYSMADGKNWLIFGIGVGCTIMLFILCILGYHCFQFLRHRDGLFAKTEFMNGNIHAGSCRNNNNPGGSFMNQQKEDNWSSEEEVFNVSMPRSFHGALPESPRINNSSSCRHSTPVKKSTPTR